MKCEGVTEVQEMRGSARNEGEILGRGIFVAVVGSFILSRMLYLNFSATLSV